MKHIFLLSFCFCLITSCKQKDKTQTTSELRTTKISSPEDEIFYHLFQRSFYDSNDDTHGDINGVTEKLDYLEDLGITSILMTPLYKSIYYHNYFPDDFKKIDEEYGTFDDYNEMVKAIHKRNMKFYMDMEIHYVTKNHIWFKDSFENPDSEYSDYIVYNGVDNTKPESMIFNLTSLESYNGESFDITTVDLADENVKTYMYDLFKYWVDPNKDGNFNDGVDGFRIDHMMDDLDWKGIRENLFVEFWAPLFEELRSINPNIKIFGEQANWNDLGEDYFSKGKVDMMFGFSVREGFMSFDKTTLINKVDSSKNATPKGKYQLIFLENHDIPRYASVVEGNSKKLKLGALFSILNKGIPSIYYGQEIGMQGSGGMGKYGVSDGNDIPMREAFEWYKTVDGRGMPLWYKNTGPWWDDTTLKDNDGISVEEQINDPNSLLSFYKELIKLRKSNSAFTIGEQAFVNNTNTSIISFCRWQDNEKYLVLFNESNSAQTTSINSADLPFKLTENKLESIISNKENSNSIKESKIDLILAPFGYTVLKIN
ncbi:alpha-amylase family glycosyl hydrolase [Changchengzhania lutea]|uniref:alpha-amylase family glycosyl hydrolase n=1 Tax=Changchengzhania lutea TaxID=2049305 RepID=UPI00115E3BDD|nr:alpha-amylase family glycosyl hydrolase [Changchengzhania lutea]